MATELDEHLVRFRKLPKPVRVVYARPRMFISIAIGVVAFFVLPASLRLVTRFLIGWDIFVTLYLMLAYTMMFRYDLAHIRRNATLQDDGRFLILLVTAIGAFASIAAIVFELGASHRSAPELGLATVTIALSWAAVHTTFSKRPRESGPRSTGTALFALGPRESGALFLGEPASTG